MTRANILVAVVAVAAIVAAGAFFLFGDEGKSPEGEPTRTAIKSDAGTEQRSGEKSGDAKSAETDSDPESDSGQNQQQASKPPSGQDDGADADAQPAPVPPSFDVVRVEPTGDAVIAGRAHPGSDVTVLADGDEMDTTKADRRGEWVVITEEPLAPGNHRLSLEAVTPDGQKLVSRNEVVIVVPGAPKVASDGTQQTEGQDAEKDGEAEEQAVAVLVPREGDGGSRVLQSSKPAGVSDRDLVLEAVDYGLDGRIVISGKATPGTRIVVTLDGERVGGGLVGQSGRWEVRPDEIVPPGLHRLRVDQIGQDGTLLASVEVPFARARFTEEPGQSRFVKVEPGSSLWVIARSAYGDGVQYTAIYQANADQIQDPDLIYPGQIFLIPDN